MKNTILILGGDGYLGWPLAMKLALNHPDQKIIIVDNLWRRNTIGKMGFEPLLPIPELPERISAFRKRHEAANLYYRFADVCSAELDDLIAAERPHTIYHLAQQCSAPYSMMSMESALYTLRNNEEGNMRLLWAVRRHIPLAHIVKLGSFGEYAKGGIPVAEGYFQPDYRGMSSGQNMPYPRAANDVYHISKINDSNYVGMASRMWNLRITEVMQSTVFGVLTEEMVSDPQLRTRFDYDPVFGTVTNRFIMQAVSGSPLTIYGRGHQRTGLMALRDAINSLARFVSEPAAAGEHRVINHVTETHYSINELAADIAGIALEAGIVARLEHIEDLRKEDVDTKAVYEVESSLQTNDAFHSDFRSVIRETIEVLQSCKKHLPEDYFIPSISWADMLKPHENNVAKASEGADEWYWENIRKKHFDSPQLNLNPGCLGTLADFGSGKSLNVNSGKLRGNPLAQYAGSRNAYKKVRKECEILWPSPGYRLAVTYSTSQMMNLVALTILRKFQESRKGPFIVVTSMHEHPGGIGPFEQLPEYEVHYLDDATLENPRWLLPQLQLMQPDIVLLSHTYYDTGKQAQNNQSLKFIKDAAPNAWLILDVAQSLGIHEIPIGVADLITGSAHKWLFGPNGSGLTWLKHSFADWLGALFWNGQQLFEEEESHGFSLPGGQDFQLYAQLHQSLELYRKTGPEAIWLRSCELNGFVRVWMSKIFTDAGIDYYFPEDGPLPCLVIAFPDYDPFPLYLYLHSMNIHIKCIKRRRLSNGETVNMLRIGIPYYETRERLSRFLIQVEAFLYSSLPALPQPSLIADQCL